MLLNEISWLVNYIVSDCCCDLSKEEVLKRGLQIRARVDRIEGEIGTTEEKWKEAVINAFKYAGAYAEIEIRINKAKRSLHFKDDGYGMPAAIKDAVFKKYVTTNGNGIGLSFCKEVMNLMQGEIECISKKGRGTEFIMIFPKSIN